MKSSRAGNLIFAVTVLMPFAICRARMITVDNDGPADFKTIQAAIDDANHFDTVAVAEGTYTGPGNRNIEFNSKAITVRSENGPDSTVLDCENKGYGVYIVDNSTAEARLSGFTIKNAYHGAVKIYSSSPPHMALGGPTYKSSAGYPPRPPYKNVIISDCIIVDNIDAGILLDGHDNAVISNCCIAGNAGGGVWSYMSWPTFRNSTIVRNKTTGIRATGATVVNCTVADNAGYGLCMQEPTVVNSIIRGNNLGSICNPQSESATVIYSNIEGGWPGSDNADVDPCFADPNNGDYHLKSQAGRWDPNSQSWVKDNMTSPCIDSGDPNSPIGFEPFPNGGIINMGAYGGTREASKSYFGKPPCETIMPGDINGDCVVNIKDFALMAFHWLEDNNL